MELTPSNAPTATRELLEERFWAKVKRGAPDECWLWIGATIRSGYGVMEIQAHRQRAHRISWRLANGPIPDGLCVLHRCDNPPCVNPAHLFTGTQKTNYDDMRAKGRARHWPSEATHCKRGHPLTGSNVYVWSGAPNARVCRACRDQRLRDARR